jgi:Mn-dependent DtxR family transcriptional regulator
MELTQQARDVLGTLGRTHGRPGARLMIAHLRGRVAVTDPVIAEAVRELIEAGYLTVPDADTIELTAKGYDAIQRTQLDAWRDPNPSSL